MIQGHICIKVMYIDLLNLTLKRQECLKSICLGDSGTLYCVSQMANYDILTSLFHKNFDKLHLGIINFLLVEI